MTAPHDQLRSDLDAIRTRSRSVLRREHRKQATWPALRAGAMASTGIALCALAYLGLTWLGGVAGPELSWPILVAIVLVPGGLYTSIRILVAALGEVSPDVALAAADSRFELADRLRTAAEFLDTEHRSPFMDAALFDASAHTAATRDRDLPEQPVHSGSPEAALGWFAAAVLMIVAACWIPVSPTVAGPRSPDSGEKVAQLDPAARKRAPNLKGQSLEPKPADKRPSQAPRARQQTGRPSRRDNQLGDVEKKTQGTMGSGQSADAASASGKSQARGAPSSQAQASKTGKKSKKKQKSKKPKQAKPQETPKAPKKPNEDSGSTAGRGAASGSNKSPSASPWNSKDQVTSEDEEDLENDEEIDDEFDNSDARGGVQPHLRDRRPPVNRDLGIGFGNQKNPDANGRGGPSEQKKSRGVASLVLGVPIPDHVKGRPNPGKTKITQERVEPQAENSKRVDAADRMPRQAPVGHLAQPKLMPWMRDLVRAYFKGLRNKPAIVVGDTSPQK